MFPRYYKKMLYDKRESITHKSINKCLPELLNSKMKDNIDRTADV